MSAKAGRQEAIRRARRKQTLRRRGFIALGVVLAVAAVGALLADRAADRRAEARLNAILTAGDCRVDTRSDSGSQHVASPTYRVDPPSGGDHTAQAAGAGIYSAGQAPPDGALVHAMEHGFVILWYGPDVDEGVIDSLEELGDRFSDSTLVVPRPSLEVPVAATAWHDRLLCGSFEERPLVEFIEAHRDKGPERGFI